MNGLSKALMRHALMRSALTRSALTRRAVLLLALLWAAPGCTKSCFPQECDWRHLYNEGHLPARLEHDPDEFTKVDVPPLGDPATVLDPEREPRYMTLSEAIALGLEHGTVGIQSSRNPGSVSDDLVEFGGNGVFGSDSIRVLSYNPARVGANVEAALSRFDAIWSSSMIWRGIDEPTQGLASFSNGGAANFSTSLAKPLSTGGTVGLSFLTDYTFLNNPPVGEFGVLNPSYQPHFVLGFEQPLLRGAGVEINQIIPSFPGSNLFSAVNGRNSSFASEGIVLARLRFDQQRADLEKSVNFLVLNVESAYWNLYGAYSNLYITEQGLRQSMLAGRIGKLQLEGGKIDISQFAQIQAQVDQFRGDRMRALGQVLDAERTLRVLIGMPVENGQRLVPIDEPTTLPVRPDWKDSLRDALNLRPELVMARQDIKAKHYNLIAQKNTFLPDLRFQATYQLNGLGSTLSGNGTVLDANGDPITNNALRSLVSNQFTSWTTGLTLNVPIGYRYEHAKVRDARMQLAQSYILLKTQEDKAVTFLAKRYSAVIEGAKVIEIRRAQRKSQAEQVEARYRKYAAGIKDSPVEFFLDAQRQWAAALAQEYQAIVDYNIALAQFEFGRGTLMRQHQVSIAEGPLPACATERAVDCEKRKTCLSVERNRMQPVVQPKERLITWPEGSSVSVLSMRGAGLGQPNVEGSEAASPALVGAALGAPPLPSPEAEPAAFQPVIGRPMITVDAPSMSAPAIPISPLPASPPPAEPTPVVPRLGLPQSLPDPEGDERGNPSLRAPIE